MYLQALKEPIIYADKTNKEIYRFTWLRTFHNPIAIRIEKDGSNYKLYWSVCDGKGGYDPGKLVVAKSRNLNKQNWDNFLKKVSIAGFWTMRTDKDFFATDGSQWILEGKVNTKYNVVEGWSPSASTGFYKCCDYLITLIDLKIKPDDKY
ncbi:hypothetical protein BC343_10180 [Mucilaginibacter pedocola]|uniref:Uncharacterized protein n=2 Tax=Mucilaginibacter pedocola TaxID=1792845 RepID=A0A1S9PAN2_9SPHI|nr:hypothetical protein BC343_10180 [Mucilaginibacter pedocola]